MRKEPDMLINHDTRILQQIFQAAMGKKEGVSITLFSINQLNISLDSRKLSSPDQRIKLPNGNDSMRLLPVERRGISKEQVVEALNSCGWNKKRAVEQLGVTHAYIYRLIRKYGVVPPSGSWPNGRGKS